MNNEKIKCQLCGTKVNSVKGISTHLRFCVNNQGENKITPEDYYLKYINSKKGKCIVCGKDTVFRTITTGYAEMCSSSCAGRSYNQLGIVSKREKPIIENGVECKLCNQLFKSVASLRNHITSGCKNNTDKLSTQEYYDKFEKKVDEGNCKCCGKETKFKGLNIGYDKYCGALCVNHHARKEYNEKKNKEIVKRLNDHGFELVGREAANGNDLTLMRCKQCGNMFENYIFNILKAKNPCRKCNPNKNSKSQIVIHEYIQEYLKSQIFSSYKIKDLIGNKEVDIFIPEYKITVEYNGVFWHNNRHQRPIDVWKASKLTLGGYKHLVIWENELGLYFGLDFDFLKDILYKIINCSHEEYLYNVEYFTTFSKESINFFTDKPAPKLTKDYTPIDPLIRPPYKPLPNNNSIIFGDYI